MLLDSQNLFSDNQKITKTADSTNIVRFGAGDISYLPLLIQVVNDFSTCQSLTVKIITSDNPAFARPVELAQTTIARVELKAGKKFPICHMPKGNLGYVKLNYAVTGSDEETGAITAGVVVNLDTELQESNFTDPLAPFVPSTTPTNTPTTTPDPTSTPSTGGDSSNPPLDDVDGDRFKD